jgi:hypothetical protein
MNQGTKRIIYVLLILMVLVGAAWALQNRNLLPTQLSTYGGQSSQGVVAPNSFDGAQGGCHPTRENPRFRCIPRDRNGNVQQLGAGLPSEYSGLPRQNSRME